MASYLTTAESEKISAALGGGGLVGALLLLCIAHMHFCELSRAGALTLSRTDRRVPRA
jgi:formate-dependent phosphoribosylglycinamide formyltransferase (GAR transformylase)